MIPGCLWVLALAIVALLPMQAQMLPGFALLLAAPVLLLWIGHVHGWLWLAIGLFAFVSMFRNPLRYILRRVLHRPAPLLRGLEG